MTITYHDNMVTPEYDAYHHLLDNWCPDFDYGTEHANVHFRIIAKKYDPVNGGFSSRTDQTAFYSEINRLLGEIGWSSKSPLRDDVSTTATYETSSLYLHPQDTAGVVKKNDISKVAEALAKGKEFKLELVDIYETIYEMADDEYMEKLRSRWNEIANAVLAKSVTARRKFMYREEYVAMAVAKPFLIRRVGCDRETDCEFVERYVLEDVIPRLIKMGYLIEGEGDNGARLIRRINKTEQRKKNLPMPVAV